MSDTQRLCIPRESGEVVVIRTADGDTVEVMVSRERGAIVLHIAAPARVRVDRGEKFGFPRT